MEKLSQEEFQSEIKNVLSVARQRLMDQMDDEGFWDFHAYLGSHFSSQYWLCLKLLSRMGCEVVSDLDPSHLEEILLSSQLSDGSWHQVVDLAASSGELNATIFNYWFLKSRGHDPGSASLKRARKFILKAGGIEKSLPLYQDVSRPLSPVPVAKTFADSLYCVH